jgi:hypothetical protein
VDHVIQTAFKGHVKLAADHILNRGMIGRLEKTVGSITRKLNLKFYESRYLPLQESIIVRTKSYATLLNIALNFFGFERVLIGFSEDETEIAIDYIRRTLGEWEEYEKKYFATTIAKDVVDDFIAEMKIPMSKNYKPPGSMTSKIGETVEGKLRADERMLSFLEAVKEEVQENIYYRMSIKKNKFGNDYALGLRWLRHLGYVQVSTNPVLAAAAYVDDPSLWDGFKGESFCQDFKTVAKENRKWLDEPEAFADEIAMKATEICVFPNLAVFRPIAIASNFVHGMVSYQLSPNVSGSSKESVKDALHIYSDASNFLRKYDEYLLWGYNDLDIEKMRPNIVFKVSGNNSSSIDTTHDLESLGIGTNNTETYTVSQETTLIISKIEGRAKAVKKGIHVGTSYETTMCGRLNDYLREKQARIMLEMMYNKTKDFSAIAQLAKDLGVQDVGALSIEKLFEISSDLRYLSSLTIKPFVKLAMEADMFGGTKEEVQAYLSRLEDDICKCGIAVTQRVYEVFFFPENRSKWLNYIRARYELNEEQTEEVIAFIDMLPASKRKPRETFLTLASSNMTNTEFPNHQTNVLNESRKPGFNLEEYLDAVVNRVVEAETIHRLFEEYEAKDECRKALQLTPAILKKLKEVGVNVKFGEDGLTPEEWPNFGAVIKTKSEFTRAYNNFRQEAVSFVKKQKTLYSTIN